MNVGSVDEEVVRDVLCERPWEKGSLEGEAVPPGCKRNTAYIETKSKRLNLLIQPSLVQDIKACAKKNGTSMNETICIAIKEYLRREKETVRQKGPEASFLAQESRTGARASHLSCQK